MFEDEAISPLTNAARTDALPQSERHYTKLEGRRVLAIVTAGAGLGIVADLLLRAASGINVALFVTAVMVAAYCVGRATGAVVDRSSWIFMTAALLAALGIAWRDSPILRGLNGSVCLFMLALSAVPSGRIAKLGITEYISRFCSGTAAALAGPFLPNFGGILWFRVPRLFTFNTPWAVLRGMLLLLPFLLLFGFLFARADAEFESIALALTDWDIGSVIIHAFWIFVFSWIATGYVQRQFGEPPDDEKPLITASRPFWIGSVEATVVLTGLNLLFFSFILVQFSYLFGGQTHVGTIAGLTMAEYARRGFFELTAVAALVLPILWGGDWLVRRDTRRADLRFRVLAAMMIGMVFCIIAGAMYRMWLYMQSYGLTELRLYTSAFMFMLAAIFTWFAATVLRNRRQRFMTGAVATGLLSLLIVEAVNPDARIVQANLARTEANGKADIDYLAKLSLDAAPLFAATPGNINADDLKRLRTVFEENARTAAAYDWRSWSWARLRARNELL